jgi:hypothetical protein
MSNIVDLTAHRRATATATAAVEDIPSSSHLRALQALEALCAKAIAAGGLDADAALPLDFTLAVYRALEGTEWCVRFSRDETAKS